MRLLPERASYGPGDPIRIRVDEEIDGAIVRMMSLTRPIAEQRIVGGELTFPPAPVGGYGIEARDREGELLTATAVDVLTDPFTRPRYGFVADLSADIEDPARVVEFARRFHLSLVQFYDWAYTHSHLLPPDDDYLDPLGQKRSLSTITRLCAAFARHGIAPLGYAAVYAVAASEVEEWRDAVMRREDGSPYRLGDDFLVLVDPAQPCWLTHFTDQLRSVLAATPFVGFHLDQYGWPKFARVGDARVDVARSFVTLLEEVHAAVPRARNVFNNVNDFPTWATANAPQDATYIEVWPPHDTLQDLSDLVERSRRLNSARPPILSAYLSCLSDDHVGGVEAGLLVMAAIFAAGGTHLLLGESGSALVDPYYPRNVSLSSAEVDDYARWYDFLVRYGDLLLSPDLIDVTETYAGGINEEVIVEGVEASTRAEPGTVWVRVFRTGSGGHVVHLVNLVGVDDVRWDSPKSTPEYLDMLRLRVAGGLSGDTLWTASPDNGDISLEPVEGITDTKAAAQHDALSAGQEHRVFGLPRLRRWTMVWIPSPD